MKKLLGILLTCSVLLVSACSVPETNNNSNSQSSTDKITTSTTSLSDSQAEDPYKRAQDIVGTLTLEQKAAQMLQPATYMASINDYKKYCFGSGLIGGGANMSDKEYCSMIDEYQRSCLSSDANIPFMFGIDAVHGVNGCQNAVIFPHNIGVGAANDEDLTYEMGKSVAKKLRSCHIPFTFSPCLATAQDPRWGRTYESYSSDTEIVKNLGANFSKGLMDGDVLPCAKHYLGDGNTTFGTGEGDMLIDRGDSTLDDEQLNALLDTYKAQIDAGVLCIMVSHSSVNGLKMHENKELIQDTLKDKLGFTGFVISDWESIHNTSGKNLREQTINAVNAGIDMFMEPNSYIDCMDYIIDGVNKGEISQDRIDDAVTRILYAKISVGLYEDPYFENNSEYDSTDYSNDQSLARQLVEKSLVLLKNDNDTLPIQSGTKIYVTGPASDDSGVLCGGWTLSWEGLTDKEKAGQSLAGRKTILSGFKSLEKDYGITVITDKNSAKDADIVVLCIGERPYAEWNGDTEDLSITGSLALEENKSSIEEAKNLGKPTVACIVSGRNVILSEYMNDWDSVVMCYLPGSEGDGVANVLTGKVPFTGTLPMPFYDKVEDIKEGNELYPVGYKYEN